MITKFGSVELKKLDQDLVQQKIIQKINKIIKNIKNGTNKYFVTSSHPNKKNISISDGNFFEINLFDDPFNFENPIDYINESNNNNRLLCLFGL